MNRVVGFYKVHFMPIESIVPGIVIALSWLTIWSTIGFQPLASFLHGNRQAAYGTVASISASMLGFVLASISIFMVFGQMPRLKIIRDSKHYASMFDVFFAAILWLAFATGSAFIGLLFDTDSSPSPCLVFFTAYVAIVASLRVFRCVWILRGISKIAIRKTS